MRCYHINNFYLSGIHAGIQSAHAQHELAIKYLDSEVSSSAEARQDYLTWAKHHKTIIVLNGGMQSDLQSFQALLEQTNNPYAWAPFHESEDALNGALTNIALVLHESMYAYTPLIMKFMTMQDKSINFPFGEGTIQVSRDGEGIAVLDGEITYHYNSFDLQLLAKLSACKLM